MMKATFLLVLVSGCAHLELPAPTRPHGRQVMATMLDSSRHSGELIGTTEELIVLGDLVSRLTAVRPSRFVDNLTLALT